MHGILTIKVSYDEVQCLICQPVVLWRLLLSVLLYFLIPPLPGSNALERAEYVY